MQQRLYSCLIIHIIVYRTKKARLLGKGACRALFMITDLKNATSVVFLTGEMMKMLERVYSILLIKLYNILDKIAKMRENKAVCIELMV